MLSEIERDKANPTIAVAWRLTHALGVSLDSLFAQPKAPEAINPRIAVTLATGIPEERCRRINLGYADYRTIDPAAWMEREADGILYVPHAGERLYRLRGE